MPSITASATQDPVRSIATGLLKTDVYLTEDGYLWVHVLGDAAPLSFSDLQITLPQNTPLITLGEGAGEQRSYNISLGTMIFDLLEAQNLSALRATGKLWGQALHHLHQKAVGPPEQKTSAPRSLQRAYTWLNNWDMAASVLGEDGIAQLAEWSVAILSSPNQAISHGYPGMAHWVTTENGSEGTLLSGEDTGIASPAYDVSWVLAEILELHTFNPALRPFLEQLREGFIEGYPSLSDGPLIPAGLAFRLTQHAYDWHHYAGATSDQATMLLRLAKHHLTIY